MTARTLLATGDEQLRVRVLALVAEMDQQLDLLGAVNNSSDLLVALDSNENVDVVLLDASMGSVPHLSMIRQILTRDPAVAVVVMVPTPDVATVQSAMDAGARAVTLAPPSREELQERLDAIAVWQRNVRSMATADVGPDRSGRMVSFVGAKGGVGTSSVALHVALMAALTQRQQRTCVVDLDMQAGGLRNLVDTKAKRTLLDLVPVAQGMTGRNLEEVVTVHHSGLRMLMAPEQGENAEEITAEVAKHIIGGTRAHFDLTVIDVGSTLTEAGAVALEFADDVILVTTPDVASVRAAQDTLDMLDRLQVAKSENVRVLFTKVSKQLDLQPEFANRLLSASALDTSIPDDFRRLQRSANALSPGDLEDGPFRRSISALGREVRIGVQGQHQAPHNGAVVPVRPDAWGQAPAPAGALAHGGPPARQRKQRTSLVKKLRGRASEAGQIVPDAVVAIAFAMILALVLLQVGIYALGAVSADRAASAAARAGARGANQAQIQQRAEHEVPGFYDVSVHRSGTSSYRAVVKAPEFLPWLHYTLEATKSAPSEK